MMTRAKSTIKAKSDDKFCRACGEKAGHNFAKCKNASAIREIVHLQDNEIKGYLERLTDASQVAAKVAQLESNNAFLGRLVHSLLDLCEAHRAEKGC